MMMAAIVNIGMWVGAIFLESKHSLALVTTTLIVTAIGAIGIIWNTGDTTRDRLSSGGSNVSNDRGLESLSVNDPLPDPMDYDIEMPFS